MGRVIRRRRWLPALLAATALSALTLPAPAAAQTADDERAARIYQNGATLYREGRYAEAIEAFEAAFELSQRPKLLLNLANAHERMGHLDEAIATLNRYRIYAQPDEVEDLTLRVANLEKRRDALVASAQDTSTPDTLPAAAPAPAPAPTSPASAPPVARAPRGPAPWILLGTGVAVAGGGTTLAVLTHAQRDTLVTTGDFDGWARTRALNNTGVGLAIAGGATALTGLVLALVPTKRLPPGLPHATPTLGPDGAALDLTWTLGGPR